MTPEELVEKIAYCSKETTLIKHFADVLATILLEIQKGNICGFHEEEVSECGGYYRVAGVYLNQNYENWLKKQLGE